MKARLGAWVERASQALARRRAEALAARLREVVGSGSVSVDGADVVVSGKGLASRWLNDPGLRFLSDVGR